MPVAVDNRGRWFTRIFNVFKSPKDPFIRSVHEAMVMLDRMIDQIESTKKNLEAKHEEHERKAKLFASEGRKDYEEIFQEESKHIVGLINMFSKIEYDLMRVKSRLEVVTVVEEPIQVLPQVVRELDAIRPEIERLAPNLLTLLYEVQRRVNYIITSSNVSEDVLITGKESKVDSVVKLPPPPPEDVKVKPPLSTERLMVESRIKALDISALKKIILEEARRTGGVLVLADVARRYGVSKEALLEALKQLEMEGTIKRRN